MTPDVTPIALLNVANNMPEDAELWDGITEKQITDWETKWKPDLKRAQLSRNVTAQLDQSQHWDWRKKSQALEGMLALRGFSIVCNDITQGLMLVDTTSKRALIESQRGKDLVYIDYIENAPWNRSVLYNPPLYSGVGSILMRAAIALSEEEGFKGRIGLHSLPQADKFYIKSCGMTCLGQDPRYHNLRYFEMTPEQAQEFINKGS